MGIRFSKKKKKFMGINDRPKYLSYTNGGLVFNSKRTPIYGRLSFRKAFPFGTSCGHMEAKARSGHQGFTPGVPTAKSSRAHPCPKRLLFFFFNANM